MVTNEILKEGVYTEKGTKGKKLKCPLCGEGFCVSNSEFNYREKQAVDYNTTFFCKKCRKENPLYKKHLKKVREEGSLKKYGTTNFFKTEEGQRLAREGMAKKYGEDNPSKVPFLKEKQLKGKHRMTSSGKTVAQLASSKAHQTMLKSGIKLMGAVPLEKSKKTCRKRYGADFYFGSEEGRMSLKNFKKRHGEKEGEKKWKAYIEGSTLSLSKFQKKWGKKEGKKRYDKWVSSSRQNKENFITRWGKKEGEKRYNKWVEDFLKRTRKGGKSKSSLAFFKELEKKLPPEMEFKYEYVESPYRIDFFINHNNKKIAVEFQGTFWHGDPRFYEGKQKVKFSSKTATKVKDLWEKDKIKFEFLREKGYTPIAVWEYDASKTPQEEIDKILKEVFSD